MRSVFDLIQAAFFSWIFWRFYYNDINVNVFGSDINQFFVIKNCNESGLSGRAWMIL